MTLTHFAAARALKKCIKSETCVHCGNAIKWEWGNANGLSMRGQCRECDSSYVASVSVTISPKQGDWSKR